MNLDLRMCYNVMNLFTSLCTAGVSRMFTIIRGSLGMVIGIVRKEHLARHTQSRLWEGLTLCN
jgi:hypothetical protein